MVLETLDQEPTWDRDHPLQFAHITMVPATAHSDVKNSQTTHPARKPARFFAKLTWSSPKNDQSEPAAGPDYLIPETGFLLTRGFQWGSPIITDTFIMVSHYRDIVTV